MRVMVGSAVLGLVGMAFSTGTAAGAEPAPTVAVSPIRAADDTLAVAVEPIATFSPIVVTGTRTPHRFDDSPVEVQLISAAQIRNSGARNVAELLQREGGVYVTPVAGRGTSIEIQGLSSDQILILVDGRRMIGRINGAIDLTRLRLDSVARVEIVKGPGSALYGADALGGVVNIITRRGGGASSATLTARIDAERNTEFSGHAGLALASWSTQASGGLLETTAYDLDASTPGTDGIEGDSRFLNLNTQWQANDRAELDFHAAYSLDNSLRQDSGTGGALFDTHKRIEEIRAGAAPRLRLNDLNTLAFDLYYNRYYDQYLQQQRGDASRTSYEKTLNQLYSGGTQFDREQGDHRLSLGVEAQFEQLDADRLSDSGERNRQSIYAQDELQLAQIPALTLIPGLRYDRDSQFGSQLSPKLAARYDLSTEFILRGSYGRGYRAPDFKQLLLHFDNSAIGYRVEGNPDLQPERGTGINLGLTWFADPRASANLSLFRNRVNNLIDIVLTDTGPPVIYSYRNVASAQLQGADLQLQVQPLSGLDLGLGYGRLDALDLQNQQRLSGRARHRANFSARWEQALYAVSARGAWIGERIFDVELDSGGAPLPAGTAGAYALLDVRTEWLGWPSLVIAAGAKNLLDAGDTRYLPIQPRTAYLEIRWDIL